MQEAVVSKKEPFSPQEDIKKTILSGIYCPHFNLIEDRNYLDHVAFSQEDKGSSFSVGTPIPDADANEPVNLSILSDEGEAAIVPKATPIKGSVSKNHEFPKSEPVAKTKQLTNRKSQAETMKSHYVFEPENGFYGLPNLIKTDDSLEVLFCKKYAGIKAPENASFTERMDFDIYKRATKNSRLSHLIKTNKSKPDPTQQEELFARLVEDGKKRNMRITQLEKFKEEEMESFGTRKITEKEFNHVLERMTIKIKEKDHEVNKQRVFKKILEEYHEERIMEEGIAYKKKCTKKDVNNMLERFKRDSERRELALKAKKECKEMLKREEEKNYFKPDLTKRLKKGDHLGTLTSISLTTITESSPNLEEKLKGVKEIRLNVRNKDERREIFSARPLVAPESIKENKSYKI